MKKLAMTTAIVLTAISTASAEPKVVSGPDLLINIDELAGTTISMKGVNISHADNSGAIGKHDGVTFKISNKNIDNDTFRKLLVECNSWFAKCKKNLTATVTGEKTFSDWPILIDVRLVK